MDRTGSGVVDSKCLKKDPTLALLRALSLLRGKGPPSGTRTNISSLTCSLFSFLTLFLSPSDSVCSPLCLPRSLSLSLFLWFKFLCASVSICVSLRLPVLGGVRGSCTGRGRSWVGRGGTAHPSVPESLHGVEGCHRVVPVGGGGVEWASVPGKKRSFESIITLPSCGNPNPCAPPESRLRYCLGPRRRTGEEGHPRGRPGPSTLCPKSPQRTQSGS